MADKQSNDEQPKKKPGPEAERLKLDMDFDEAAKKLLRKKRPPGGWPDNADADRGTDQ